MSIGTSPELGDELAVRRVRGDAVIRVAGVGHHRLDRGEVDRVDAAVVDRARVGRDDPRLELRGVDAGPVRGDPPDGLVVGLADPGPGAALRGHVRERRALVHRQRGEPGPAELHDPVERLLRPRVVEQDVEHHVLRRDARVGARP